jgi:hypothetical protein
MIHRRHFEELESAVRVARRAVTVGIAGEPDLLAHHLYARWYLRRPEPSVATALARPWQTWSPLWTADLDHGRSGSSGLVRLDLSIAPPTALHVVAAVTERARGWEHPWRLDSVLPGPSPSSTAPVPESTVLYLPVPALVELRPEIEQLLVDLRPFLARDVPALTLRIGHGASLAQQPADGRSFGEHRCRLVAGAVLDTMRCHHREQVDRAISAFADAGIDPERPYLERQNRWDRPWRAA